MLRLYWAKTPAQYMDMYKEGGPDSCMTIDDSNTHEWGYMEPWDCPVAFYAYVPGVVGAYLKETKTGAVKARTIVFTDADGAQRFNTLYSEEEEPHTALERRLSDRGIKRGGGFHAKCQFEIPARTIFNTGKYFPVPSIDGFYGDKQYKYIKSRDVFKIRLGLTPALGFSPFYSGTHGKVVHPVLK